jgi:hypothetical protein
LTDRSALRDSLPVDHGVGGSHRRGGGASCWELGDRERRRLSPDPC